MNASLKNLRWDLRKNICGGLVWLWVGLVICAWHACCLMVLCQCQCLVELVVCSMSCHVFVAFWRFGVFDPPCICRRSWARAASRALSPSAPQKLSTSSKHKMEGWCVRALTNTSLTNLDKQEDNRKYFIFKANPFGSTVLKRTHLISWM